VQKPSSLLRHQSLLLRWTVKLRPQPGVRNQRRTTSPVAGLCDLTSMGHLLGYARVFTADQHPRLQIGALKRVCHRVVTETACGSASGRPVLDQVLHQLRPGDTLVVSRLGRRGRSERQNRRPNLTVAKRCGELGCEPCSEPPEDSADPSVAGDDGLHALIDGASDVAAVASIRLGEVEQLRNMPASPVLYQ
jgi:Resolvase, N terminal domain